MNKKFTLMLWSGLMLLSFKSYSQDPNFHIYLLFGQSNMEGQGPIEAQDRVTNPRVKLLQDQTCSNLNRVYGQWVTAAPPLNRCFGRLGPGDYFGKTMADGTPSNVTIGLVAAAVSGCDIAFYQKGAPLGKAATVGGSPADIPSQFTGGYAWLLDLAKKAKTVGVIKGIIFHQGETNTNDPNWKFKVQQIVNDLRTDLSIGNVPFLAGELLYAQFGSCCSSHNTEVNKLPGIIPNSFVISASGLPGQDVAHFTSASYREFGRRYAQKMLSLEGGTCTPTAITSFVKVNTGAWTQATTASVTAGGTVMMGPQPVTGGSWTWAGPNGFSATTREITLNNIQTGQAGNYMATYTNPAGCKSTSTIVVTVTGTGCTQTAIVPFVKINTAAWVQSATASLASGGTIILGPQPVTGGSWKWTGPNGFTAGAREITLTNIQANQGGNYVATFTNAAACNSTQSFTITVTNSAAGMATIASGQEKAVVQEAVVAPNPSSGSFTLHISDNVQSYTVFNNRGSVVIKGTSLVSGQSIIFGEMLSNGWYTLRIQYKTGRVETKIIRKVL